MRALASVAAIALVAAGAGTAAAQDAPPASPPPAGTAQPTAGQPGDPPDAAAALQAAAATGDEPGGAGGFAVNDPWEGFNRKMWGLNMTFDRVAAKPASTVYRTVTPRPARRGLSRILANLSEPFSAVNGLLQGKPDRAFNSLGRFVINMTAGVGGLADQATAMGLHATPEDFGQTLAHWGVKSGPYVVLPLLGPSTVRDGVGSAAAFAIDPYRIAIRAADLSTVQSLGLNAFTVISARSDLTDSGGDTFLKTSLDSYAAARSAYLQRREQALNDQDDGGEMSGGGAGADDAALEAAVKELQTEQQQGGEAAPAAAPTPTSTPNP